MVDLKLARAACHTLKASRLPRAACYRDEAVRTRACRNTQAERAPPLLLDMAIRTPPLEHEHKVELNKARRIVESLQQTLGLTPSDMNLRAFRGRPPALVLPSEKLKHARDVLAAYHRLELLLEYRQTHQHTFADVHLKV